MLSQSSISKASIIAELEELGFVYQRGVCNSSSFVYKVLDVEMPVIAFYRETSGALLWKYGYNGQENRLQVFTGGKWMSVDLMPISSLLVLYK